MATAILLVAAGTVGYLYAKNKQTESEIDQYAYLKHEAPQDADITFVHTDPFEAPIPVGRLVYDTFSDERAYGTWAAHEDQKRANEDRKWYSSLPWAGRPHTDAFKRVHPDWRHRFDWDSIERWEDSRHATEREIADEESPNFTGTTAARTMKRHNIHISTVDPSRAKRWAGRLEEAGDAEHKPY